MGHRDGHGFVRCKSGRADVYLSQDEMRNVLHHDKVRGRIFRQDRKGRPEGQILEILERPKRTWVGRLVHENGLWLVALEDKRLGRDVLVHENALANARPGQVVAVELTEVPSLHAQPMGRVTEVLGEIDDPGIEIEIAVRKYQVPHLFSAAALTEVGALPERVRAADLRGRVDLRDIGFVTIDGEDARDFDDAVYCEPHLSRRGATSFKGWRLLVAIADVSHYVKAGTALDLDAYERGTSVYFPRRVIPMLPEKLSNGLCSLNPHVDRLSLVCDMLIDQAGQAQAYQFYSAVICSAARLNYTQVAEALKNTRGPEAAALSELLPRLTDLHAVYRALSSARKVRGAIDFETTETSIVCDPQGHIERILPRVRNDAHRLIEEAMLAANVCAAEFIASAGHPSLFRVHEGPTPEKRAALVAFLRELGIKHNLSEAPRPAEFQAISQFTQQRVDAHQIHTMLLRSMRQAVYAPENLGHFGLAYSAYTHFTSPIRRYPDLLIHRVIKALVQQRQYAFKVPLPASEPESAGGVGRRGKAQPIEEAWSIAGVHCSSNERRADEASRDVEAWLKCRYMREHLGEVFAGTVSAVAAFGVFVTLDTLFVEGLVHITELGAEYFQFDEIRHSLRGERTGMRFQLGTQVRVQVSRVDLDARRIDFKLLGPADDGISPPESVDRGVSKRGSAVALLAETKAIDRARKKAAKSKVTIASTGAKRQASKAALPSSGSAGMGCQSKSKAPTAKKSH